MERFMPLLLDVWREACRHIGIADAVDRMAPLLVRKLPADRMLVRRLDLVRSCAETVAASALGAVGARGVGSPELDLLDVQQTGIPSYPIVNVDGSRVVKASDALLGAHRDIFHREVGTLIAMAAGLLVGSPQGARPRPVDPIANP